MHSPLEIAWLSAVSLAAVAVAGHACGGQTQDPAGVGTDSGADTGPDSKPPACSDPVRPKGPGCAAGFVLYDDTRCELVPGGGIDCWPCSGAGACFQPCVADADCKDPCFPQCRVFNECSGGDYCHDGPAYCVYLSESAGC